MFKKMQKNLSFNEVPEALTWLCLQVTSIKELLLRDGTKVTVISKPLTTKELCEEFSISQPTVIRWRKKGQIPYMRIGGSVRYDREAVRVAIENKKIIR